jgi:hypothetical protein
VAEQRRGPSLELEHDEAFHQREWRVSSLAWFAFLGLMLATGLGVFGSGPLSHAHAEDPDGALRVEYERFARFGAPQRLLVHARPGPDGTVRFLLGHSLRDAFQIRRITPEPESTTIVGDGIEYRFAARGGDSRVVLDLQPARRGIVEAMIRSPEGAVEFSQLVYP